MEITADKYFGLNDMIDQKNEEISIKQSQNVPEEDLEEDYVTLGRMIIQRDLMEEKLKADMDEEQLKAFDKLIELHEKEKMLKLRQKIMEAELEEMLETKKRVDETIEYGERVMDMIDNTIAELEKQAELEEDEEAAE